MHWGAWLEETTWYLSGGVLRLDITYSVALLDVLFSVFHWSLVGVEEVDAEQFNQDLLTFQEICRPAQVVHLLRPTPRVQRGL